jgi:predicted secreted acid phosphatase
VNKLFKLLSILSLSLLLSCNSIQNHAVDRQTNKKLSEQDFRAYHDSGRYQQELTASVEEAQDYIVKRAAYYHSHHQTKLALVLDIDETSISNYISMAKYHFKPTKKQIRLHELKAHAPAIQPTLALYKVALKNGIKVFFVTGRRTNQRYSTATNLHRAGYDIWSGLYFRPSTDLSPSVIPYKSGVRAKIEKKGYVIIATVGDQYSDIKEGHADKGFKLPNPFYYIP